jgi:hypothetical protein
LLKWPPQLASTSVKSAATKIDAAHFGARPNAGN